MRLHRRLRGQGAAAALAALAALALAPPPACRPAPAAAPTLPPAAPEVTIAAAGGRLRARVEVAGSPAAWQRGLMGRAALAERAGMLFVFPDAARRPFWMRGTHMPLDLVFIGDGLKVVEVVLGAQPRDERSLGGQQPARLVLEVAAGRAARCRVEVGDRVHLQGLPRLSAQLAEQAGAAPPTAAP